MADQTVLLQNIGRLGIAAAAEKQRLTELSDDDVVRAFAVMLGKAAFGWGMNVAPQNLSFIN